MLTPTPIPLTLNYAPPPSLRYGRLALGMAVLASCALLFLGIIFVDARVPSPPYWTTLRPILNSVAIGILFAGIWILGNVLPPARRAVPWANLSVRALACLGLLLQLSLSWQDLSTSYQAFWSGLPPAFAHAIYYANIFIECFLAGAGILFMARVARSARSPWIGTVAACVLGLAAFFCLLVMVAWLARSTLWIPNQDSNPFFHLFAVIPTSAATAVKILIAFALAALISLWALARHRAARPAPRP